MTEAIIAGLSVILTAVGLLLTVLETRKRELRRDDILVWAKDAIALLQETYLLCCVDESDFGKDYIAEKSRFLAFQASVLTAQGRLFFKNVIKDDWGAEKPAAFRGYRPEVLDHLVVAHQINCALLRVASHERPSLQEISGDRLMRFITCLQSEVGRERTASIDAATEGQGIDLLRLVRNAGLPPLNIRKNWV